MKRRTGFVFGLLIICFIVLITRVGTLSLNEQVLRVGQTQGNKRLTVSTARGTIYDRNGERLVNDQNVYKAALMPEQDLLSAIRAAISSEEYLQLLNKAKERLPLSVKLEKAVEDRDGLQVFRVPERNNSAVGIHLIGYLDGAGDGASGMEKAYESLLNKYTGELTMTFPVDGAGQWRSDEEMRVENTLSNSIGGVQLTLDKNLQLTVDEVANRMIEKGAVVVSNPNGEILAMSSRPTFDPQNIDEALLNEDGSLVNRALSGYDCGSVFKIVTAAAALEYGISENQGYLCEGKQQVGNTLFHCHNRQGHGLVGMNDAFAKSCNLYFIQLAQEVGGDRLLKMAEKLGLYDEIVLADGLVVPGAILPTSEELQTPATLANLSFGQGKLLVSPLHIARMTAIFTANGTLPRVRAVLGTVSVEGKLTLDEDREGETVLSATNTNKMKYMMEQVVEIGTGSAANSQYYTTAGKTGTAETGQLDENGVPITQSWFTGYFPADDPEYVVTVLVEDAGNSEFTAAQVFCEISNNLKRVGK